MVWNVLHKGKVIFYLDKLNGYKPHVIEAFFKKWVGEEVTLIGVSALITKEFIVEITSLL